MLIKLLTVTTTSNDNEYRKTIKSRRRLLGFVELGGVLSLLCSYLIGKGYFISKAIEDQQSFLSGLYAGIGTGLIVAGIIALFSLDKQLKDPAKLRAARLKETDERNVMIAGKSSGTAGMVLVTCLFAALLIAGFFNITVFWTIWACAVGYFIIMLIAQKYYSAKL